MIEIRLVVWGGGGENFFANNSVFPKLLINNRTIDIANTVKLEGCI
jgi:hypothetical protein